MARPNAQSGQVAVTAEMYARVFETHYEGRLILDDLLQRFGGQPYRKGGLEAQRATDFHCGQNDVVNFIVHQINRASETLPPEPEEPTDG